MMNWEQILALSAGLEREILAATKRQLTSPSWNSYFYLLIAISLFFWGWEAVRPWRTRQLLLRRDFWLDGFYMFFNMFLVPLLGFYVVAGLAEAVLLQGLGLRRGDLGVARAAVMPHWAQLIVLFVVRDFAQWLVHNLLHRIGFLWELHKVHHSVKEMGFAAHLRYHWGENLLYRSLEYLPIALMGFGPLDFFSVYAITLFIGHWNHANIRIPLGPLQYVLNNPQMHIWHHARDLPAERSSGVNFGLSLSVWDYLFGTAYIPHNGRDIPLGFPGDEDFPQGFLGQVVYPLQVRQPRKSQEPP